MSHIRYIKKKLQFVCFLLLIGGISIFLIYKATTPTLPSASQPIIFYANQSRHDLKLLFSEAIHSAQRHIYASFYGVTDHDIIAALVQKAESGVETTIEYDHKASLSLVKRFPTGAQIIPKRCRGLMHKKVLVIDGSLVFLGSANLTLSSLRHHSNLVLGLYSPLLAKCLTDQIASHFTLPLDSQEANCWLLPNQGKEALNHLLSMIQTATKTIRIAMFTFTHPDITTALIAAKNRGVNVHVIIDSYSGRGASKKSAECMSENGICVRFSQGQQLLHHKWALFDQEHFVMGSANWTKAAFTKNEDFLFTLSPLSSGQKNFLNGLWDILELEAS